MKMRIPLLKEGIEAALKSKLVAMVLGSPACGKSDVIREIASKYNLKVIDFRLSQCDPTTLDGFPTISNGQATFIPMDIFPLEGSPLPKDEHGNEMAGWLLFFDEITSAVPAVQAAAYKIVLDRMVGSHHLHKNVAIVAAGNLETDNAVVEPMSTALQSRLVTLELEVHLDDWLEWAATKDIDHRIAAFLRFKPSNLYTFKPDHTDFTYAAPRTWNFANKLLKQIDVSDAVALPLLAGTISEGVANEFLVFCRIYESLPTIAQIIKTPKSLHVPDEPSVLFALTGSIAHNADADNIEALIEFVYRMPAEFQAICLKETLRVKPALRSSKFIQQWISKSAVTMF